ncbi:MULTISPECIES: NfeD family protein [Anaerosinus]|uniref:NfeD family protein n=1 Tax=Selenobaculum gibii TaxID=3054208 RepID=A0A9Y2ERZ4_9FIRM|nr:NfeD family protein [Selenobaculum gbiensis]WIW69766.1 NfeD family protein [Selenobaculum gbiensis]
MQTEFMALPVIKILLMTIIFLSLLVEIKTAGMGVGALFGLIAASVFFASQFMTGLVSLFEIALFLVGIIFVVIELLTPSIGLFAGIGVICVLYSFIMALGGDSTAIYLLVISIIASLILFGFIVKKLPSSKLWSKVVLKDMETSTAGYVSADDHQFLVGKSGVILTELRPSGTALIENKKIDVVSEGSYIEKGTNVKVVAVFGSRIVVRQLD